ncbi:hypothetical protein HHI36_019198 [Cryptolaemus montrouzieri]|uniref:Small-subunit processome Utp12 domain-containing protein n=1 Tax=Cryptolaemus montrouzieri TaxID=559131 RepID=A0ABD2P2F6_9CUCU
MSSQFDKEGRYFAYLADDGRLKIWNTASNSLDQEYVPDLHLTSPCTCLQFIESWSNTRKNGSPRKKKRRDSTSELSTDIILGTTSGRLIVYSISKGDVSSVIDGDINLPIGCLSPNNDEIFYSGAEENVVVWNISQKIIINKWKCGNDKISAILAVPNTEKLLTASKNIKLWNVQNKTLLKTFRGHSSEVSLLQGIPQSDILETKYVISGSKGDRLLNCWNISEDVKDENTTASFLMEDTARNISLHITDDGSMKLAATVTSGVVHIFQLVLNGKCTKPVKPKSTIQVVSDTGQKNDVIIPIPIVSCFFKNEDNLLVTYGSSIVFTFEDVALINNKLICLIRESSKIQPNEIRTNKVLAPIVGNNVNYITPYNNVASTTKRKAKGKLEVPMEERLENLKLNKLEYGKIPTTDNMAQLLLQGLRSKDQNIIKAVFCRKEEQVIKNTVRRLPLAVISELVKELTTFIQGKTVLSHTGALWLRHLLQTHAALLISNPNLSDLLAPVLNSIENRLTLQSPLSRLRGRLKLIVSQITETSNEGPKEDVEALVTFNDKDLSDSDREIEMAELLNSASENEWAEESSSDQEMQNNDESDTSDNEDM